MKAINPQNQESQQIPSKRKWHQGITIKLLKRNDKEKVLKAVREKDILIEAIKIANFSSEIMQT